MEHGDVLPFSQKPITGPYLSQINTVHSLLLHSVKNHFNIGPPSTTYVLKAMYFFLSCVPTKTLYALIFPSACHILHSFQLSLCSPPNNIWPGVRIMMITKHFSQAFCYFLPLRFKL